jgi:hypothetical protein
MRTTEPEQQEDKEKSMAAPSTTRVLMTVLGAGILVQAVLAGGLLSGHHSWVQWHEQVGDCLLVLPVASLFIALVARRRQPEPFSTLAVRVAIVLLVLIVEVTGHAGGEWLILHIPAALATTAAVVHQGTTSMERRRLARLTFPKSR